MDTRSKTVRTVWLVSNVMLGCKEEKGSFEDKVDVEHDVRSEEDHLELVVVEYSVTNKGDIAVVVEQLDEEEEQVQ